jgi:hypothetical protein
MVPTLFFYQLVLVALVWLCVMLQWAWPSGCAPAPLTPSQPTPLRPKRRREPKPFAGVTHKPPCDACAQASASRSHAPLARRAKILIRSSCLQDSWDKQTSYPTKMVEV